MVAEKIGVRKFTVSQRCGYVYESLVTRSNSFSFVQESLIWSLKAMHDSGLLGIDMFLCSWVSTGWWADLFCGRLRHRPLSNGSSGSAQNTRHGKSNSGPLLTFTIHLMVLTVTLEDEEVLDQSRSLICHDPPSPCHTGASGAVNPRTICKRCGDIHLRKIRIVYRRGVGFPRNGYLFERARMLERRSTQAHIKTHTHTSRHQLQSIEQYWTFTGSQLAVHLILDWSTPTTECTF